MPHDAKLQRILSKSSLEAAPALLGCLLTRVYKGRVLMARIVETEAYDMSDAASHSFRGETPRNAVMFGPPGFAYVYFTYGMHYCMNIVTDQIGHGSAVLIRAVEPSKGAEVMEAARGGAHGVAITNGPAKLCQALAIDKSLNGHDLSREPLRLELPDNTEPFEIVQTTRIGITQAVHEPWRFYIQGNPYVSRLVKPT